MTEFEKLINKLAKDEIIKAKDLKALFVHLEKRIKTLEGKTGYRGL